MSITPFARLSTTLALSVVLLLSAYTASAYQEAPMLAERVARGELPPVERTVQFP